jgi:hypothetical protein
MNNELQFLLYTTAQEDVKVNAVVKDERLWLTQKAMTELFDIGVSALSKHIKNIFEEGELPEQTTISKMETVVNRGFRDEVNEVLDFYNLDKDKITKLQADRKAEVEYNEFNKTQKIVSDFDNEIKKLKGKGDSNE